MGDCGCEKTLNDLEEFLHNELCSEEAGEIREHIANCADCLNEHRIGIVLTKVLKLSCVETAPEELKSKLLNYVNTTR